MTRRDGPVGISPQPGKALTIRQPWAGLIVAGHKDVENRTWATKHRGRLWIHAGQRVDSSPNARQAAATHGGIPDSHGAILGWVTLIDVVQDSSSPWAMPGHWHWVLDRPMRLPRPFPCQGKQGLWDFHRPWAATERLETHPPKPSIEPVIEYVSAAAYLGDPEVLAKLQRISRLLYGER